MSYATMFSGEVQILPPCGKQFAEETRKPDEYKSPYAPWRINEYGWLIMPSSSRTKWPYAAKNLRAIVDRLRSYDYELRGEFQWQGESPDDFGRIIVDNDEVTILYGERIYPKQVPLKGDEENFNLRTYHGSS